jgi:hypothetical protein
MFTKKTLQEAQEGKEKWKKEVGKAGRQKAEKGKKFSTVSDLEIKPIYTPEDIKVNPQCIEGGSGPFACSPGWAVPRIPIRGGITFSRKARRG